MNFKSFFESLDEFETLYADAEPRLLNSPVVRQELASTGQVKIVTIRTVLGVAEGESNYIARVFNQRHRDDAQYERFQKQEQEADLRRRRDDFYYHVLPSNRLKKVLSQGITPNSSPVFSNYTNHSVGRIFLSEREGVHFWKERVELHLFHNGENEKVSVIRVRKSLIKNIEDDKLGTRDSNTPSYYTKTPISADHIEIVEK